MTSSVFAVSNLKREKTNRDNSLSRDPKIILNLLTLSHPSIVRLQMCFFNLLVERNKRISTLFFTASFNTE